MFQSTEQDIGPLDLENALGRWAVKLKQSGLLMDRIQQRLDLSQKRPSDAAAFRTRVVTMINFYPGCHCLYDLLLRSLGPEGMKVG